MKILLDNGEHELLNKGDIAMMQATLDRIRSSPVDVTPMLVTTAPWRLRMVDPGAVPVRWIQGETSEVVAPSRISPRVLSLAVDVHADEFVRRSRRVIGRLRTGRGHAAVTEPNDDPCAGGMELAIHGADIVGSIGGGFLTDVDPGATLRVLGHLEAGANAGRPTVLFAQGVGPLTSERLRARAAAVLPRVDLIALRESVSGPHLLAELGVSADRVHVTGDDALGLAVAASPQIPAAAIGVSLRESPYSPIGADSMDQVRQGVHGAARAAGATLVELSVSEYLNEDRRTTRRLTDGYPKIRRDRRRSLMPRQIIDRVGSCRVLVTSTYHLAVFALGQGIPVVGLSRTAYYDDKFRGLADFFPGGLSLFSLDDDGLGTQLQHAIERAWEDGPSLRGTLTATARELVARQERFMVQALALGDPNSEWDT